MARFDTMQARRLTRFTLAAKSRDMTRISFTFALVAAAALAGCNNEGQTIVAGGPEDPMANQTNLAEVKLPPAIVGSHKYRCKDNSVVSIDWLSDGTANSARVTPQGGAAVTLAQAEAGGAYAAEGASLSGDPKAQSVTFNGQSCKR
jgi:hypothetical protein